MALLLFLSLLGLASSSLVSIVTIDKPIAEYIALSSSVQGFCIESQFRFCQANFDEALGLPTTVTWKDAALLLQTFQTYADANITKMKTLCSARAQFAQCLGTQYAECVSVRYLLGKDAAAFSAATTYVASLSTLDFVCSKGIEEARNQHSCLKAVSGNSDYKACVSTFQSAIAGHPEKLCREVRNTGLCMHEVFTKTCQQDSKAGWFGCQSFSASFTETCSDRSYCALH